MPWTHYGISYPNGEDFTARISADGFLEMADKSKMIYVRGKNGIDYRFLQQIRHEINRVLDEAIAEASNAS